MNLNEIMKILGTRKCQLFLEGEKIRIRGPKGAITDNLRKAVEAYKPYLIERLRKEQESNKGGE